MKAVVKFASSNGSRRGKMFGFLKNAAAKEHVKLMHQNYSAAHYIEAFNPDLAAIAQEQVRSIHTIWQPGKILPHEIANSLLDTNRALRRMYNQTPAKYSKSFDDEFQPVLGWKRHFQELGLG